MSGVASADTAAPVSGKVTSGSYVYVNNSVDGATNVRVAHLGLQVGGETDIVYCIDFTHSFQVGDTYDEKNWSDTTYPTSTALATIKWILGHSYPAITPAQLIAKAGASLPANESQDGLLNVVYAGTQTAIWSYSDPTKFALGDYKSSVNGGLNETEYHAVQAIYKYLRDNAKAEGTDPTPTLTISPATATGTVGKVVGPFTVTSNVGDATVTATGGKVVDKSGKAITTVPDGGKFYVESDAVGPVSIKATAEGSVPTGRIFFFHNEATKHEQKLILAGTAGVPLTATAAATVAPAPSPSASASPSGPPSLPVTGARTGLWAGLGLLLIVGGAVLVMVLRRRRVKFVA